MESNTHTTETKMSNALENRIALMTETETVDGLNFLKESYGLISSDKWDDATKTVRAELLMALEDVHGWSEYRAAIFDARVFWGPESVSNVEAQNAAGIFE
jgi:hypothetical protein